MEALRHGIETHGTDFEVNDERMHRELLPEKN